jgi:hypothetical protein
MCFFSTYKLHKMKFNGRVIHLAINIIKYFRQIWVV